MLAFVVIGDEGDADRFPFGNSAISKRGGEPNVHPAFGHAELLAGHGSDEFVGAAAGGIGDSVTRATGEGFAARMPFAPICAAEVFPDFVARPEDNFRFAGVSRDGHGLHIGPYESR